MHGRSTSREIREDKSRFVHAHRDTIPGSARVSRVGDGVSPSQAFGNSSSSTAKFVSARRRNQHARRARYPGKPVCDRLLFLTLRFLQLERGRGNRNSGRHGLSFFFLRRSFFAVRAGLADFGIGLQRKRGPTKLESGSSVTLANEADRSNILAPGLRPECFSDSPFSRLHRSSEHGHSACAPSGDFLRFPDSAEWNSAGRTDYKSMFRYYNDWLCSGGL